MARVRIPSEPVLKTWEDVNLNLKEILECQLELEKIETELNDKIADLKLDASVRAEPFRKAIKELEKQIKEYSEANRLDFGDKKSISLDFGEIGFRKSTKVSLPRAGEKLQEVIRKLKLFGMKDCIISPPEKVDRDALKKYPEQDIIKVGATLKVDDTFWYETNKEKMSDA